MSDSTSSVQLEKQFYYELNEETHGPFSEVQMLAWYRQSFLPSHLLVTCKKGKEVLYELSIESLSAVNPANPFIVYPGERTVVERIDHLDNLYTYLFRPFVCYFFLQVTRFNAQHSKMSKMDQFYATMVEAFEEAQGVKFEESLREKLLNFAIKQPLQHTFAALKSEMQTRLSDMELRIDYVSASLPKESVAAPNIATELLPSTSFGDVDGLRKLREEAGPKKAEHSLLSDCQLHDITKHLLSLEQKYRCCNGELQGLKAKAENPEWKAPVVQVTQDMAALEQKFRVLNGQLYSVSGAKIGADIAKMNKRLDSLSSEFSALKESDHGNLAASLDQLKKDQQLQEERWKTLNFKLSAATGAKLGVRISEMTKQLDCLTASVEEVKKGGVGGGDSLRESIEQLRKDQKLQEEAKQLDTLATDVGEVKKGGDLRETVGELKSEQAALEQRFRTFNGQLASVSGPKIGNDIKDLRNDLDQMHISILEVLSINNNVTMAQIEVMKTDIDRLSSQVQVNNPVNKYKQEEPAFDPK